MSGWDAYITNLLDSCSGINRAAIIGLEDASVWARSPEFKASALSGKIIALFRPPTRS